MNSILQNEQNDLEQQDWKKDPYTLRVKGGDRNDPDESKRPTDPKGLAKSILHVLQQNPDGWVRIKTVGPVAFGIAHAALREARNLLLVKTDTSRLVWYETSYITEINGKKTKGICTKAFVIPSKYEM